jgi:hypothetical protein
LSGTLTYDITAWSLPFVYGFDAYQVDDKIDLIEYNTPSIAVEKSTQMPYSFLLDWTSIKDAKFLCMALDKGFKVNYSTKSFTYGGSTYCAGTLIINRIDNDGNNFPNGLLKIADSMNRKLVPVFSGSSISTIDLGSQKIKFLTKPRVAMLAGPDISTLNFGELWYFFEQELDYPIDIIEKRWISNVNLSDYDVLLLASGNYSDLENEKGFMKVDDWVKSGGNLILIEKAINGFIGKEKFSLVRDEPDGENLDKKEPTLFPFEDNERENLKKSIRGSIIKMEIDNSHPLAYGYDKNYYTLKNHNESYKFLKDGWQVFKGWLEHWIYHFFEYGCCGICRF